MVTFEGLMVTPVREDILLYVLVETFLHAVHVLEEVSFCPFVFFEGSSLASFFEH